MSDNTSMSKIRECVQKISSRNMINISTAQCFLQELSAAGLLAEMPIMYHAQNNTNAIANFNAKYAQTTTDPSLK